MFKQPSLLDKLQERRWPPAERFPLNLEASKVEDVIRQDLLDSRRYVIIDLYHLSQLWLDLLRPRFLELMQSNKRKGPVLLKDLKRHLREHPLETESLRHLLEGMQTREPLEKGIAACLLGVVSR
ncbi:MAG TPA: hypothetical protein ENJ96_06605 [Thermodesulfatator atlanticus]|uniref:Uncharacterized protein n=1 Tax=Thermodesulfatator atlanticus TaxID=501497 RepID=A0A7V5P0L2_9BACT|nr:hypothetical protein [Thermodesulfatator atlanticus]